MQRIALHSAPRSGSTWLGEIINSHPAVKYCYQPLFSYALKSFLNEQSTKADIDAFFDRLARTDDEFILQSKQRQSDLMPQFRKDAEPTHIAYKEVRYHHLLPRLADQDPSLRFVLLIRNPLEVIASWVKAPKEFNPAWSLDEELLEAPSKNQGRPEEFYGLAKWVEATQSFLRLRDERPDQIFVVDYADLEADPIGATARLFDFCGLDLDGQTADFIRASQTENVEDAYSVFKGARMKKAWAEVLSDEQVEIITDYVTARGLEHFLRP